MPELISHLRRIAALTLFVCVSTSITGCSQSDGPKLYPVTGKVTFEGEPVKEGRITLRKVDGDKRSYSGSISEGRYELTAEAGPSAVEVIASRLIPGKFDRSNGTPEPVGEMYIPKKYNEATTLQVEVKSGSNDFPFDLKK